MKKRAALYLRVSKDEQATGNQLPDVRRLVRARGLTVVETYEENVSAVKARPEFTKMMAAAHRAQFEVLVVWSLCERASGTGGNRA